jgi:hypothetical protein
VSNRDADIQYLRENIERLEDKAKADLKIALYGSSLLLVVSWVPYGDLHYASMLVSAIDLWYFMSWGNDQLRLAQYRVFLKEVEGPDGIEARQEHEPNYGYERGLYFGTSLVVLALFLLGLGLDYSKASDAGWLLTYYVIVGIAFVTIAVTFGRGWAVSGRP